MNSQSELRDYKVYLDGVAPVRVIAQGTHFHILEATSKVTLDFDGRVKYQRSKGQGGDVPKGYLEVFLSSEAPQTVVIALGDGRVRDNAANVNFGDVTATINVANVNGNLPIVNCPSGIATLLASANINRKELRVNVDFNQPNGVYIGGAGIIENQGGFVDVGVTDYIPTQAALYCFNNGSSDVSVNVFSLEYV